MVEAEVCEEDNIVVSVVSKVLGECDDGGSNVDEVEAEVWEEDNIDVSVDLVVLGECDDEDSNVVVVEAEVWGEDNLVVSLVSVILDESEDEGLIVVVIEAEIGGWFDENVVWVEWGISIGFSEVAVGEIVDNLVGLMVELDDLCFIVEDIEEEDDDKDEDLYEYEEVRVVEVTENEGPIILHCS